MPVRSTMSSLLARVRLLIYDPAGTNQVFDDQTIQDVLDESRLDVINGSLSARPTFSGASIQYLDYYASLGDWEDGMILKQYLTVIVTPSTIEPIVGHFQFSSNVFPPVYITGFVYDKFRAAADLLERKAAQFALSYNVSADGQNLQRAQIMSNLLTIAKSYRMKQRPTTIALARGDLVGGGQDKGLTLAPTAIDYMTSGNKGG